MLESGGSYSGVGGKYGLFQLHVHAPAASLPRTYKQPTHYSPITISPYSTRNHNNSIILRNKETKRGGWGKHLAWDFALGRTVGSDTVFTFHAALT